MKTLASAALAVVGGVAWALCFGSQASLWLPWLALVPLIQISHRPRPVLFGFLHGLVHWLVATRWIVATLESYGGLSPALALGSLVLMAAYLGCYHAVFSAMAAQVWRRTPHSVVWALPAIWVLLEVVRAHLLSGFPWNLAAYAAIEVPGALDLSAWTGSYGLSFLVLAVNVAVVLLLSRRHLRSAAATFVAAAAVLLVALLGSSDEDPDEARAAVSIVQPNAPILTQWDREIVLEGYRRLMALSEQACEPGVLVVWPESAAWPFVLGRDEALREGLDRLASRGCTVILNSVSGTEEKRFNSAFLLDAGGGVERYDKGHLVPFGEYVPLPRLFPFLRRLARAAGDFFPGEDKQLLSWGQERLGLAICFEIVFPGEVAERVRQGATILVTITNDGWYGNTAAPWQHFRAARFRAAENRRPVLRAALTGVSAIVSPRGAVTDSFGVGEQGVLRASVAGETRLTFYTRFPWLVPALCGLLLAFAILRAGVAPANRAGR